MAIYSNSNPDVVTLNIKFRKAPTISQLMSEWKSNTTIATKELNWEIEENTLKDLYKKIEE